MTTMATTSSDLAMRDAVLAQLQWDTRVNAADIGVSAHRGAVTLSGFIDSYAGKLAAERAAKRVRGVRAVANELQVSLRLPRSDAEIARDVAAALEARSPMVPDTIQASVRGGQLTLTGTAATLFERRLAESSIGYVRGLIGITNRITVVPTAVTRDVQHHIVAALHRDADVDARGITVVIDGSTATLTGQVRSWTERESAEIAAAHAPGITHVDNRLVVVLPERDVVDDLC